MVGVEKSITLVFLKAVVLSDLILLLPLNDYYKFSYAESRIIFLYSKVQNP